MSQIMRKIFRQFKLIRKCKSSGLKREATGSVSMI